MHVKCVCVCICVSRMDQPLSDACHEDIDKVCNLQYRSATVEYPPSHVLHCLYTSYLNPAAKVCINKNTVFDAYVYCHIHVYITVGSYLRNSCNMGSRDLPDMYARGPQG